MEKTDFPDIYSNDQFRLDLDYIEYINLILEKSIQIDQRDK